nr:DUF6443 domain-containing protein [uncultured Pedobacter sp.]
MKKIQILFICLFAFFTANAALQPGDIVVVGLNTKGYDQIAIMATRSFYNEHFNITDAGWNASGGFRTGEGTLVSRISSMQAGEILTINLWSGYGGEGDEEFSMSGTLDLAASGDQLIIYQGAASNPNMVYALNYSSRNWAETASDASSSALPTGLINGYSAVSLIQKESYKYAQKIDLSNIDSFLYDLGDYNSWMGKNAAIYAIYKNDFQKGAITNISPGDFALIGFNDKLAEKLVFMAMRDITGGTLIKITDKGWTGSKFSESEGTRIYVVPVQGLNAGQVVNFSPDNADTFSNENFALSTSGDQVFVYQGSSLKPRFIYAYNSRGEWATGVTSAQTSMAPDISGLNGLPVVRSGTQAQGNGHYIGTHTGTYEELLMAFADPENYLFAGGYNQSVIPDISPFNILIPPPPLPSFKECTAFSSIASEDQNYISTKIFKVPGIDPGNLSGRSVCEVNEQIQYLDGLGRPVQNITVQGSPTFDDQIEGIVYDGFGREEKKYLPYTIAGNKGAYRDNFLAQQRDFYLGQPAATSIMATQSPFSLNVFETSPLERIVEYGAEGDSWQPVNGSTAGHTTKKTYGTNIQDEVKYWTVSGNGATANTYLPGRLYKITTQDENWKNDDEKAGTVEEFRDFQQKLILKRIFNKRPDQNIEILSTYYIYDEQNNLRYVLPPAVNEGGQNIAAFIEGQESFDDFIYSYHYDSHKRQVAKKIPGKGWENILYNQLDQVVAIQDAIQAAKPQPEWIFNKYDAIGRIVMTGLYKSTNSPLSLQNLLDNENILWESRSGADYTTNAFPQSGFEAYAINYYDDYTFNKDSFGNPTGSLQVGASRTNGLQTGSRTLILGSTTMLLTLNYYDDEGHIVQVKSENHLSGTEVVTNTYNFAGELISSNRFHTAKGKSIKIDVRYEYDHLGRKLAAIQNINKRGEVAISKLSYDQIGQLKERKQHSTDGNIFLRNTKYSYNERGWLKNAVSDQFSLQLNYQDALNVQPQYNGNISNQFWGDGNNPMVNSFSYTYDKLNRLAKATSQDLGEEIEYDLMGNIKMIKRDNYGVNNYSVYSGNQLKSITGFINSNFDYDVNGNLKTDDGKKITLNYNYLNLVTTVSGDLNVEYLYTAGGKKLRKTSSAGTINYLDGIQCGPDGNIEFIQTEEGIARKNGDNYSYEYNILDHLGNVRARFYKNPNTEQLQIIQRDDYYAFGQRKNTLVSGVENKYLYNGKEFQDELKQYDYGARFYDPAIGRWNTPDPLSELTRRVSPYNYALNNPIRFIDPDGMMTTLNNGAIFGKSIGESIYEDETNFKQMNVFMAGGGGKKGKKQKEKAEKAEDKKAETEKEDDVEATFKPVPPEYKKKGLPGFPGSKQIKSKSGRVTWDLGGLKPKGAGKGDPKMPKGTFGEWDSKRGEVEIYNKEGNHQGAANPETGEEREGSQEKGRRTTKRFDSDEPDAKQIIETFTPIDQPSLRIRSFNLPIISKPNPVVLVGGAIGTIIVGLLIFGGA